MVPQTRSRRVPWHLVVIFFLLAAGIVALGWLYYVTSLRAVKQSTQNDLLSTADLKVQQIVNWRRQRLAHAEVLIQSPFAPQAIQEWFANPSLEELKQKIATWVGARLGYVDYKTIFLLDTNGTVRLTVGSQDEHISHRCLSLVQEA